MDDKLTTVHCSFGIFKKTVKVIGGACLTIGITSEGVSIPSNSKSTALHEAAHAVVGEMHNKESVAYVYIAQDGADYRGLCRIIEESGQDKLCEKRKSIVTDLAGYAQDLQDKHLRINQNSIELELGFPLSNVQNNTAAKLQSMLEGGSYYTDCENAYKSANEIALKELGLDDDCNETLDSSIKKQFENRVQDILIKCLDEAEKNVKIKKQEIHAVAAALCKYKFLFGNDVREIIKDPTVIDPAETVSYEKDLAKRQNLLGDIFELDELDNREFIKKIR